MTQGIYVTHPRSQTQNPDAHPTAALGNVRHQPPGFGSSDLPDAKALGRNRSSAKPRRALGSVWRRMRAAGTALGQPAPLG